MCFLRHSEKIIFIPSKISSLPIREIHLIWIAGASLPLVPWFAVRRVANMINLSLESGDEHSRTRLLRELCVSIIDERVRLV